MRWDESACAGSSRPIAEGNSLLGSQYGGGPEAFFQILRDWREAGALEGVELS